MFFEDAFLQLLATDKFQDAFCQNCPRNSERLKRRDAFYKNKMEAEIAALDFLCGLSSAVTNEAPVCDKISKKLEPPCTPEDIKTCLRGEVVTELCKRAEEFEARCWDVANGIA